MQAVCSFGVGACKAAPESETAAKQALEHHFFFMKPVCLKRTARLRDSCNTGALAEFFFNSVTVMQPQSRKQQQSRSSYPSGGSAQTRRGL